MWNCSSLTSSSVIIVHTCLVLGSQGKGAQSVAVVPTIGIRKTGHDDGIACKTGSRQHLGKGGTVVVESEVMSI